MQSPNDLKTPTRRVRSPREREEKEDLEACLEQRWRLSPFVASTDGLLGKELSTLLAEKWKKPYSEICGYVNARMSIAMVRATHLCVRGSRILTSQMSNHRPQWEDKAGLGLFQT
jgi:hypothetical protein